MTSDTCIVARELLMMDEGVRRGENETMYKLVR